MKTTMGGDRLGSGNQQKVDLKTYSRSTHDLGYVWRSTMASGVLVPFMSEVGLPGDSFDINLNCNILTHPTIGPLFGSYKVQLDVFKCPVRLYQGLLHMNMQGIGMDMSKVKLPQLQLTASGATEDTQEDNSQINASCILSYLNIRGLGRAKGGAGYVQRNFNAVPYLAYWDIYKNYYANKQEEVGVVIHNGIESGTLQITGARLLDHNGDVVDILGPTGQTDGNSWIKIYYSNWKEEEPIPQFTDIKGNGGDAIWTNWQTHTWVEYEKYWYFEIPIATGTVNVAVGSTKTEYDLSGKPKMKSFPLENIDNMRKKILMNVQSTSPLVINEFDSAPYGLVFKKNLGEENVYSKQSALEGLGVKTYQSDLFNNWVSTEWITGDNGINEITKVDTTDGGFTIDTLNLSKKVYDMLNRIAISGGSYDDWLDAVYTHERMRTVESPVYMGGLIKEIVFQEVISNTATETGGVEQPLGTLAGRGVMAKKNKGGNINVKIDEPSYIMGIISITPRIDYSQGNKWDTGLKTLNDFHKPALDEIGFQDLITDQMAWFDTEIENTSPEDMTTEFKSAGKQPAWINYMTNVNQIRGNFADKEQQMFMTLNRRYEQGVNGITDLTTYIDPSKFNHIFADTRIDAQNFWAQIGLDITARRKMSSKIMPNL